jgi:hypothetical protein
MTKFYFPIRAIGKSPRRILDFCREDSLREVATTAGPSGSTSDIDPSFNEVPLSRIVEKLELMERRLEKTRPFTFFALLQREGSESWDLVVSADWLNPDELRSWDKMAKLVTKSLSHDELVELGRIVILKGDNLFLGEVLRLLPKGASLPLEMENFTFSGVRIQHGRIMAALKRLHQGSLKRSSA